VSARRLAHALLLAAVAMLLGACMNATLTRLAYANGTLAYNNLGPVLTWMADGYVDLNGTQEDWVRARIARALSWHRAQELPKYRGFLERALAKTAEPFTADDVEPFYRELRRHWRHMTEQVIPDTAELLAGLDAEQATQLEKKFAEDDVKYARESLRGTPEERRRKRINRFSDHLQVWLGSLTDEQRALVAEHYRELPDLSDEVLGDRRYRQGEIVAMVRSNASKEDIAPKLRKLFVEPETWRRPEYQEKLKARERKTFEMLAALSATLSADQRAALQSRIRAFMKDIANLTAAG